MNYQTAIEEIEAYLKHYMNGRKAIIGLSGGIDSAVVAALCIRALGKENVLGVLMPYGSQDMNDAKELIRFLGIEAREVNIAKMVDNFDFINLGKLGKGNVMARTRMIVLYAFANEFNGLVVGTSNKTEIEIGYFTKYGDGGVDLEPIGDLYKTEIFEVAKLLQIPAAIITKKPSAGLYDGQTDEGEIGATYAEIDSALQGKPASQEIFSKIDERRRNTMHKRIMPPTFMIRDGEEVKR